jgi:diguanylate cyclase
MTPGTIAGAGQMRDTLERWWRRPDHFDWLSAYIADHGLRQTTRAVIGTSAAATALAAGGLILSPSGPHGLAAVTVSALASVVGLAMAGIWLVGWPTRRGSAVFALVPNACFASVCLVQSQPIVGLMGCCVFATIGGYIALFHTSRFMAFYLTVATVTTTVLAVRVASEYDPALGGFLGLLVAAVNLSVSWVVHMLIHLMRIDVLESERDPLTSLLNRRGFDRATQTLLATPPIDDAHLVVLMVDLDRFKVLNDDLGHAVGDQALIAVADVLRHHAGAASVIGRVGGEEFLIAEITSTPEPVALAGRLCRDIAATPYPITASIGTSTAALRTDDDAVQHPPLSTLIAIADAAMYAAKRGGGNRAHHSSQKAANQPDAATELTRIDEAGPPVPSAGTAG